MDTTLKIYREFEVTSNYAILKFAYIIMAYSVWKVIIYLILKFWLKIISRFVLENISTLQKF